MSSIAHASLLTQRNVNVRRHLTRSNETERLQGSQALSCMSLRVSSATMYNIYMYQLYDLQVDTLPQKGSHGAQHGGKCTENKYSLTSLSNVTVSVSKLPLNWYAFLLQRTGSSFDVGLKFAKLR